MVNNIFLNYLQIHSQMLSGSKKINESNLKDEKRGRRKYMLDLWIWNYRDLAPSAAYIETLKRVWNQAGVISFFLSFNLKRGLVLVPQVTTTGWCRRMLFRPSRITTQAWSHCLSCKAPLPMEAGTSLTTSQRSWSTLTSKHNFSAFYTWGFAEAFSFSVILQNHMVCKSW